MRGPSFSILLALLGACCALAWTPVEDAIFLQEVGQRVRTDVPVTRVAVVGGDVYAVMDGKLFRLDNEELVPVAHAPDRLAGLDADSDGLWAYGASGLSRMDADGIWHAVTDAPAPATCVHDGTRIVAGTGGLSVVVGNALTPIAPSESLRGGVQGIASYAGTIYILTPGRLAVFTGIAYDDENVADWGALPSRDTRDMLSLGNRLVVATAQGLGELRGMSMRAIRGAEGLPYEDTTCLAMGFADDYWIGTTRGAVRAVGGEYHYFAGQRWLPNDAVNDIACGNNVAVIATDGGLGIIRYEPYTLLKKAAYYERWLEAWGQKRMGFTHKLERSNAGDGWVREISDNDAGFSTHYLAAQCFKYAVTGDLAAKAEAENYFTSLVWSERISSIEGYPARSIWAVGERGNQAQGGSGGYPAEWIPTKDGRWQWKSDTSSDETDAHVYATSIFHDLVADPRWKAIAEDHWGRIAKHIMTNGWVLRDLDGKPTRWGRWDPEYLQRPQGFYARGLNGMEALSYMATALDLTKDPAFEDGLKQLMDWGYPREILREKLAFPAGFVFHSDDRLAFYAYFAGLRHVRDPYLKALFRRSLERSWEIERIEGIPWFNFIYGALTGNDGDFDRAAAHLREWPLDCVAYEFRNSHRSDLTVPNGYRNVLGDTRAISPRERGPQRWTDSTLQLDGGSGGREVVDPSGWLDAYWMGRYFGFIKAPATGDPALTEVAPLVEGLGAAPYDGPSRPSIEEILAFENGQ